MQVKFKTEFNRDEFEDAYSNAGDQYLPQYIEAIDKHGRTYLKENGKTNVYEKIQASLEETKTYNILERYAQTGDANILVRRESIFGDFTDIPTTPIELQNLIMKAGSQFEQLDKDVRAAFDNDAGIFKQSILDGSFEERIAKFKPRKPQTEQAAVPAQPVEQEQQAAAPTEQQGGVNLNE